MCRYSLVTLTIFFLSSCSVRRVQAPPPPPAPDFAGVLHQQLMKYTWSTSQLMGVAMDVEDPNLAGPSLRFESGGRMTGSTGCNSFMGTYMIAGDKVLLDPGPMTKKACEGGQEQKFLEAIRRTVNLRLSGERIDLVDDKDQVLAQLRPKKL